jgi:rhamnulokinase
MNKEMHYYAAIDLGASSGRLILGHLEKGAFAFEEVHRFKNGVKETKDGLVWDVDALFHEIVEGLKKCKALQKIPESIAIDTWGVDYALLDKEGHLIPPVFAYRDGRGEKAAEKVHAVLPFSDLYQKTGIQYEPFNTIYQLYSDHLSGRLEKADDFLMVPAYLSYCLSGKKCHEYCECSTSGLLEPKSKKWNEEVLKKLCLPLPLFQREPQDPPFILGPLKKEIADEVGFNAQVVMVASHDTASSVVALPSKKPCTFLSSGTWSLLGIELSQPLVSKEGYEANFTNEGGVDRIRYLKNIMGLWLVQCLQKEYPSASFVTMAEEARKVEGFDYQLAIDDPAYLMPEKVTEVIVQECQKKGYPVPTTLGEFAYAIYCSLANDYARALASIKTITGIDNPDLYVVGGGSKNAFLNELIAKKTHKNVILGSSEATSLGNLAMQALALGDLKDMSALKEAIIKEKEK